MFNLWVTLLYFFGFFSIATFLLGFFLDNEDVGMIKYMSIKKIKKRYNYKFYIHLYLFYCFNTFIAFAFIPTRIGYFILKLTKIKKRLRKDIS